MRPISRWQYQFLGIEDLPAELGEHEIQDFFTFPEHLIEEFKARFRENAVPAALMHGFIRMTGRTMTKVPKALPREFLKHLADQFGVEAPSIASLKTLYSSRPTLFRHQKIIRKMLGFTKANPKQKGSLVKLMKKQADDKATVDLLMEFGKIWFYQHSLLIPGDSWLEDKATAVVTGSADGLCGIILSQVSAEQLDQWERRILAPIPDLNNVTYMEWLATPPRRRSLRAIKEQLDRIDFLKDLKVDQLTLKGVALERIHQYAEEMRKMRPAKFAELKEEPLRTLRLACFLRHCLTNTTDDTVAMCHRHIWDIWTDCQEKAKDKDAAIAIAQRSLLNEIFKKVDDPGIDDAAFRNLVRELKKSDNAPQYPSRAAAARQIMTDPGSPVRALLHQVQRLDLQYTIDSSVAGNMDTVKGLYHRKETSLSPTQYVKSQAWESLLNGEDRERAMRALEAHTLLGLRKGLRNGSVYIDTSGAFRSREALMISKDQWGNQREAYYANLGLPLEARDFTQPLRMELKKKLQKVAAASDRGELHIEDGKIKIPRVSKENHPKAWKDAVDRMGDLLPVAQLPDVILQVDAQAGFTRALLNRPARSEEELMQVYAGMLAHATGMDATAVALMLPGVEPEDVQAGMTLFEDKDAVRAANDAVVAYHLKSPLTKAWGDGRLASSDSMSVNVSPKMWKGRRDYRRRLASVGVYTHVLNQWILFHDLPIMLNERQAGVALEGILRHRDLGVDQLAVDTHGYTEFAMCQGALLKVALVPRIKKLEERKLHCPSNIGIPVQLESVTTAEIVMQNIHDQWDELVRVAASMESGKVSATIALARFGTAAQGDPVYAAGVALGRLIRSLYLCDYFLDADFRREINRILAHGESIHTLQRAICTGSYSKPRGARQEELIALSGSLTLVTNVCLCWTTRQIQQILERRDEAFPEWVKIISPARTAHINFRGTFSFPIAAYADRLIARGPRRATG